MRNCDSIPDDIIVDILSWLPSTSLLRFRIACKSWYSLISHPKFNNLRSRRSSQSPKLLFSTGPTQFQLLDYESSSFDSSCLSAPFDFPLEKYQNPNQTTQVGSNSEQLHYKNLFFDELHYRIVRVIGVSCGLVCVALEYEPHSGFNQYCIWNPFTRECRKIPNTSNQARELLSFFHGFGYDSVSNDFKLVKSLRGNKYNVFSLRSNSWKTFPIPGEGASSTKPTIRTGRATVINGVFYWLMEGGIIGFDAANEKYQKLRIPVDGEEEYGNRYYVRLLEHKGCLCVSSLYWNFYSSFGDLWTKKECSWIHLVTIEISLPIECISSKNEVVCSYIQGVIRSIKKENRFHEIRMPNVGFSIEGLYVESLISPYYIDAIDFRLPQP